MPGNWPEATRARRSWIALSVALILVIVWGTNFSLLKLVMAEISPMGFLFARYVASPICAVLMLLCIHGLQWPAIPRGEWPALAGLALLGHVFHVQLMTWGVYLSTAFSSALIAACGPVFTLILVRVTGTERLSRAQVMGVGIACAGVVLFLWEKLANAGSRAGSGDLILLAATCLFSTHTVAAMPMSRRHGPVLVMAYSTLLGSVPVLAITGWSAAAIQWSQLTPAIWLGLAWAVVVSSFTGWIVWGWVNADLGVVRSAPLMYLLPPIAGVVSWFLVAELFTPLKIAGAFVALSGVACAQLSGLRRRKATLDQALAGSGR